MKLIRKMSYDKKPYFELSFDVNRNLLLVDNVSKTISISPVYRDYIVYHQGITKGQKKLIK